MKKEEKSFFFEINLVILDKKEFFYSFILFKSYWNKMKMKTSFCYYEKLFSFRKSIHWTKRKLIKMNILA